MARAWFCVWVALQVRINPLSRGHKSATTTSSPNQIRSDRIASSQQVWMASMKYNTLKIVQEQKTMKHEIGSVWIWKHGAILEEGHFEGFLSTVPLSCKSNFL